MYHEIVDVYHICIFFKGLITDVCFAQLFFTYPSRMSSNYITDQLQLKLVLFNDYLLIKQMQSPQNNKIKLRSALVSINPNSWRVIGITTAALEVFKQHDFKKVSGMGINRSHIIQRHSFYNELINQEITDHQTFWDLYHQNDCTILATSTENMSKSEKIFHNYYDIPNDERNLFQTAGYAWKHKEEEEYFLKELYEFCLEPK